MTQEDDKASEPAKGGKANNPAKGGKTNNKANWAKAGVGMAIGSAAIAAAVLYVNKSKAPKKTGE